MKAISMISRCRIFTWNQKLESGGWRGRGGCSGSTVSWAWVLAMWLAACAWKSPCRPSCLWRQLVHIDGPLERNSLSEASTNWCVDPSRLDNGLIHFSQKFVLVFSYLQVQRLTSVTLQERGFIKWICMDGWKRGKVAGPEPALQSLVVSLPLPLPLSAPWLHSGLLFSSLCCQTFSAYKVLCSLIIWLTHGLGLLWAQLLPAGFLLASASISNWFSNTNSHLGRLRCSSPFYSRC